jgi:hypothetical protein
MARTAVVAGTATAVSNRVSRRQADRWQTQADAQAYQEQQMYAPAPPPPPPAPAPAPAPVAAAPAAPATDDVAAQLLKLGELKNQGLLSEEEFAAAKARLLGI